MTLEQSQIVAPEGAVFQVKGVMSFTQPHPYCIGSKHVAVASDHHGGILDQTAIEDAEKRGAKCMTPGCRLPYSEHKTTKALVVAVPDALQEDLNAVPGLGKWLASIKG